MLIQATQLRPGMVLEYNGGLWRVMTINHITPGNWRGMVQTKLRNIQSGTQTENRFRSEDRVERVILDQVQMEFLYREGKDFHFMNTENYDQITLPGDLVEDVEGFLTPNLQVEVEFYESTPLNVTLPKTIALKVVETEPGIRTAAVTNTLKPAKTETGLVVQVPALRQRRRRHYDQHRDPGVRVAHQVGACDRIPSGESQPVSKPRPGAAAKRQRRAWA